MRFSFLLCILFVHASWSLSCWFNLWFGTIPHVSFFIPFFFLSCFLYCLSFNTSHNIFHRIFNFIILFLNLVDVQIDLMSYISSISMSYLSFIHWFFLCSLYFRNFKKTSWWYFQFICGLNISTYYFLIRKYFFQVTF